MEIEEVTGKLFKQFDGPYLYVKPEYEFTDISVVVEQINSEGYVMGNYSTMTVRQFESESIELVGEYDGLREARSAVAGLTGNPDPNP
jgi:hypothetical protein